MLTDNQREYIEGKSDTTGLCDHCGQTIKIYRYTLNKTLADFLWRMGQRYQETGRNDIDISTLGMPYGQQTQMSKMRQHGLIARVKSLTSETGAQEPNHWLITTKGFCWLRGEAIPEKVVVFNNQVLGHDGGMVTMKDVVGTYLPAVDAMEPQAITEPEARVLNDVRTPAKQTTYLARYIGKSFHQDWVNQDWLIRIDRLQVGRPVSVLVLDEGDGIIYRDIAAFQKDWKIIRQEVGQ